MKSFISFIFLLFILHLISVAANPANYEQAIQNQNYEEEAPRLSVPTLLDNLFSDDLLSFAYYNQSCPDVEAIINRKVNEWVKKDKTLAASLLRLHFHDCAVNVRMIYDF